MTTLVLGLLAVLLAGPVPALMARVPLLRRTPRAAMVLWQSVALAAVLAALGAGALADHEQRASAGITATWAWVVAGGGACPHGAGARPAAAQRSPDRDRPPCATTTPPRPGRPARAASMPPGCGCSSTRCRSAYCLPGRRTVARRRLGRRPRPAHGRRGRRRTRPRASSPAAPATTWSSRRSTSCTARSRAGCPAAPPCSRYACSSRSWPTRPPPAATGRRPLGRPSSPSPRPARPHSTAASPWRPPAGPDLLAPGRAARRRRPPPAPVGLLLSGWPSSVLVLSDGVRGGAVAFGVGLRVG